VSLTVRDIAKRIARRPADVEVIVGRLRHWTAEGLLSPSGDKNPGTGRSREYGEDVLEDAVILNALADIGFQIGLLRTALTLVRDAKAEWREKAKQGVKLFLEIDMMPDGTPFVHQHEGMWVELPNGRFQVGWMSPQAVNAHIFDLTQLFSQLHDEKE
jgi:DNA-binding transcriptional MerR regulator